MKADVHEPPKSPKSRNQLRKKLSPHSYPLHLTNSQEQLAVKIESIEFEAEDQVVEKSHKKVKLWARYTCRQDISQLLTQS